VPPHRPELEGAALVRELYVYGPQVGVGLKPQVREWQHRGYGEELLAEATEIHIPALPRVGCTDSGGSSVQILI
jgi:histone acetyltransferase (RNA polymerase elongator complex component)